MVVQHLHTVPGVSSNLTFTTKFCKCQQVETRSKYSSKVLRRKRQMGSTPTLGELRRSVTETTLVETQVISIVLEVRLGGR